LGHAPLFTAIALVTLAPGVARNRVIAYAVSQRTREIGIRMALGAQPAGLQRVFVRHGLVLAAIGAGIGLAAAVLASYFPARRATAVDPIQALRAE